MTATRTPPKAFDLVFDSQAIFRTVLDAMARPGTVATLPAADDRCPLADYRPLAAVARALLDHEVGFAVAPGDDEAGELARYLVAATGSRPVAPGEADYAIARAPLPRGLLTSLKRGTLTFPDEGATLLVLTPDFARPDAGPVATLTGPGIPGARTVRLAGLTAQDLAERRVANAEFPRGIDLLLIDPLGRVSCLPRTTGVRIENEE
jgi:alpha-D-ribose 1-methylphosphonate 5-triphosphate synthase subunit PhnH